MFERLAPALAAFFLACFGMALIFGSVVLVGSTPVTPEIYGEVVYAVPALVWAGGQAAMAAMAVMGCMMLWPRMAALGAIGLAALFLFFAAAAVSAGPTGTLLVSMAVNTAPLCAAAAWIAWRGRHGSRR